MTLLTTHTQRYDDWQNRWCRDIGSNMAKIVNPPENTPIFPDVSTLIVRFHEVESWQWETYIRHGYDGGRRHIRDLAPRFRKVVHPNKILETANEPPCANGGQLAALNAYWLGCLDEADAQGIKIAIGHIPEGNPAADQGLTGDAARASERWKLEQMVPAVKACAQRGHYLGWHAYWHPQVEGPAGRWHALGRIKWTIDQFLSMGVSPSLRVIVSEFGIDGLIQQKIEGWRALSTPDAYRAGLIEAETYARTIPQILSLCLFTVGWEPPWQTYDHDEAFLRSLIEPVRALGAPAQSSSSGGSGNPSQVETVIGAEAQKHILPLNPNAAFEKAGAAQGLLPASQEFDITVNGVTYRAQAYRSPGARQWQHIVYCRVGEWNNLRWFKRKN